MIKRILSVILSAVILLSVFSISASAENAYEKCSININFEGVLENKEVIKDSSGTIFAPISWLTYYGMMKVDNNEDEYECYYPEQAKAKNFAKRIFISKDSDHKYSVCFYYDESSLFDEITSYFDKFKVISEAVNSADSKEKVLDNIYRSLGVANRAKIEKIRNSYKPIYEGNFSKSITENNEIYFPIYEILPLINSKVVIDDGTLYISPNRGSVFKALYNSNIGSLVFDADSDLGYGKTFMDITAYTCSTLFTGRIDRLDFITKSGKRNDYETVFSDYLTDDEVYLAAFDNASPLKDEVDIAKDLLGGAKTAFGLLDKLNVKNTKTDTLKKFEKVIYSKNSEFVKNIGNVSDTLGAVKDLGDYFYTYLYQVEDHRKMLGAVYNYDFSASSIDEKNNSDDYIAKIAAQNIQDKYSEHMSTAALSYVASNLRDEFEKNVGKNAFEKYSSLLTAIDATESIMRFIDSTDKALDIMDEGVLVNYMDQSAKKAYNVYIARRSSDSFDSASLNDLRLSAIMTLIASKKAYSINILSGKYDDKLEKINTVLKKLYLASDGAEYEGSDYYPKKQKELMDSVNNLIVSEITKKDNTKATSVNSHSSEDDNQVSKNDNKINNSPHTYVNKEYGWRVELPEEWNEYGLVVDNSVNPILLTGADTVNFCHKEIYNSYGNGGIFSIIVCPLDEYNSISDDSFYTKITENTKYVYLYHEFDIQFDKPLSSEKYNRLLNECNILHKAKDSIIESFKLLE